MKFKSKVCTSKEQSYRLLAAGLSKLTADMYYTPIGFGCKPISLALNATELWAEASPPAWSLDRLIELANFHPSLDYILDKKDDKYDDLYEVMVGLIEVMIKSGNFNKEYLK